MAGGCAALTLTLFLSLKREIRDRDRHREEAGRELTETFNALAVRVHELEQDAVQPGASAICVTASMNVTKRTHALRRMRQGERPEQIASALNVPLAEIELLAKVNRMVSEN
jgi:hypothetical protein